MCDNLLGKGANLFIMEEIICKNCGLINDYTSKQNGPHIEARCNGCGKHIKFLPQSTEPVIYFGKYSQSRICDITDLNYLEWLISKCTTLKPKLKEAAKKQIDKLKVE